MKQVKLLSLTLIVVCLFSCSKEEDLVSTTPALTETNAEVLASIERTWCYSNCPVYKFKIYSNGYAEFEGIKNVEKIGLFHTKVKTEKLSQLKEFALHIDYFNLHDEYLNPNVVDMPETKTHVSFGGKTKSIVNGNIEAPWELIIFERFIDGIMYETDLFKNDLSDN